MPLASEHFYDAHKERLNHQIDYENKLPEIKSDIFN